MKAFMRIFCSCNCTFLKVRGTFCFLFLKHIHMKIRIKSTFKIYSKQLNFFFLQNDRIRNMYIYGDFLKTNEAFIDLF